MSTTIIRLPRASAKDNVLDTLASYPESMRDVAWWAPSILDESGEASPRDARWLRAFLTGPLRWHVQDEDHVLYPWLALRRSQWLEACLGRAVGKYQVVVQKAQALLALLEPLCAGNAVPRLRWGDAARAFAAAVDDATRYDDDILLPTARLFLDANELGVVRQQIVANDDSRPWQAVAVAGDAPLIHRVHAVRVRGAGAVEVIRSFAACPRRRAIGVDSCAGCPHLEEMGVGADGRGHVACAIDDSPTPAQPVVGDYMTRDVLCVTRETPLIEAAKMITDACISGMPVVDDHGRAIGIVSQSDIVNALSIDADVERMTVADVMMHAAFVVKESDAIDDAARLLVIEGIHRLPVVNADKLVVGILSTLDVLRATVTRPRAPQLAQV